MSKNNGCYENGIFQAESGPKAKSGVPMKQTARPQQVIDRLAERWAEANRLRADCKLGLEPPRRRGGGCSACTTPQEFELDQGVAQLINAGVFKSTGQCPYQVITSYLIAGLSFGPEAFRARSTGQYRADPVVEIRGALKRIHTVTKATKLTHEDIEALSDKDKWWEALNLVCSAERALENALALFRSRPPGKIRSPRGPAGALHIQTVARAMAGAWRALAGHLPAKDNEKFHDLLAAAVATVFGHPAKVPNWESATRTAVERMKNEAASRT
jgi:hypothetical protein